MVLCSNVLNNVNYSFINITPNSQYKFKDFVKECRPVIDLDTVATGEHWLGRQAHHLNLVDDIRTSDDYLMSLRETADIFEVEYTVKKKVLDRLSGLIGQLRKGTLLSDETPVFTRLS